MAVHATGSPQTPKSASTTFEDWIAVQAQLCNSPPAAEQEYQAMSQAQPRRWNDGQRSSKMTRASDDRVRVTNGRADDLHRLGQQLSSMESFVRRWGRRSRLKGAGSTNGTYDAEAFTGGGTDVHAHGDECSCCNKHSIPQPPLPHAVTPAVARPYSQSPAFFAGSCDLPFPRETTSSRYYESGVRVDSFYRGRRENDTKKVNFRKAFTIAFFLVVCVLGSVAMIVAGTRHSSG